MKLPAAAADSGVPSTERAHPSHRSPAESSALPPLSLTVLYRGSLVSCNYGCTYCPFAKRRESRAEMDRDRAEVERFVEWARASDRRLSILFTPWGEALVRPWYQQALCRLSNLPHVERVAIQTNLSMDLAWTAQANLDTLALWATFHPSQVSLSKFTARCRELHRRGVRHSVGVVGLRESFADIEALRASIDPSVYVWINAYKREPDDYTPDEIARLTRVDPLFELNTTRHPSLGLPCRAGDTAITVDGEGTVRRCHFIKAPLGNIYEGDLEEVLGPRPCTNATCGCFIGYVHLEPLDLYRVYAGGILERIPVWFSGGASPPDSPERLASLGDARTEQRTNGPSCATPCGKNA